VFAIIEALTAVIFGDMVGVILSALKSRGWVKLNLFFGYASD